MRILIIILLLKVNIYAQISGQIIDITGTLPGVKIELKENNRKTESDFDGNFSIEFPSEKEKTNVLFKYEMFAVEIKNVNLKNKTKVDFGEFTMPYFKSISTEEYETLSNKSKSNCEPIYSWNHTDNKLIGYYYYNEISEKYITWSISGIENKIYDFKYNKRKRKIIIDWKSISN